MLSRLFVACVTALIAILPIAVEPATLEATPVVSDSEARDVDSGSWIAGAQESIRLSEYHFAERAGPVGNGLPPGFQAPNRAQGLRFGVSERTVAAVSRTEDVAAWRWSATIEAGGDSSESSRAPNSTDAAAPCSESAAAPNAVVIRSGARGESRYTNTESGLEQELVIRIATTGRAGEVPGTVASLTFDTDLSMHHSPHGGLEFRRDGSAVVRYRIERAEDSRGATVIASLQPVVDGVSAKVVVDASEPGISYPLTVRARITGVADAYSWSGFGDAEAAHLGASAATAGDVDGDG